ncbi:MULTISPECIES: hypothetical protein [Paenibacillus]|uniref:hypothetical protein n=1 Tax=Paenibacillus TaxID=44249 RepID=UPI00142DEBCF|nr:hypothetical protein [Paenibacillus rhizosphaerae]
MKENREYKVPKDISINAIYEPNMEKMVKALKIVLESPIHNQNKSKKTKKVGK